MQRPIAITLLTLVVATSASTQSVAAAGQPPAQPGRFGFSLECVNGCSFVEAALDPAHFKHRGEPRVSQVQKGSAAERAGLRVGDFIADVDSLYVTTTQAGIALWSDSTEILRLSVRNAKGAIRDVVLYSIRRCDGTRGVSVGNHTGEYINVVMRSRTRSRVLGSLGPGQSELPIPMSDSLYRVSNVYFYAVYSSTELQGKRRTGGIGGWEMRVSFKVICHEN